jgi:hypothetical protein
MLQRWHPEQEGGSVRSTTTVSPLSLAPGSLTYRLILAAQRQAATHQAQHAANRARGGVPEFQARRVARKLEELEVSRTSAVRIGIGADWYVTVRMR